MLRDFTGGLVTSKDDLGCDDQRREPWPDTKGMRNE